MVHRKGTRSNALPQVFPDSRPPSLGSGMPWAKYAPSKSQLEHAETRMRQTRFFLSSGALAVPSNESIA
jgi:hypothetical protein